MSRISNPNVTPEAVYTMLLSLPDRKALANITSHAVGRWPVSENIFWCQYSARNYRREKIGDMRSDGIERLEVRLF
jgi:hypothetical protein